MPPRIRTRASKALKENIDSNNKLKNAKNTTKETRKPLADKTNSASDDTSVELPAKTKPDVRPRRDRRLPTRFEKNSVLVNLSKSSENVDATPTKSNRENSSKPIESVTINDTPVKISEPDSSPFKTPAKTETSLVVSRPRRICRLPSRFDDHSISPNKYIPIQPANASTPKQQSNLKPLFNKENAYTQTKNLGDKQTSQVQVTKPIRTAVSQTKVKEVVDVTDSPEKSSNAHPTTISRPTRGATLQKKVKENILPEKVSPEKQTSIQQPTRSSRTKGTQKKDKDNVVIDVVSSEKQTSIEQETRSSRRAKTQKKDKGNVSIDIDSTEKQPSMQVTKPSKTAVQNKEKENVGEKVSPDTNNNAKARSTRAKRGQVKASPPKKLSPKLNSDNSIRKFFNRTTSPKSSPVKITSPKRNNGKKINVNNLSFKVLEDKKKSQEHDPDIYEFTFNPEEEPQPQKKKRKKPVTKKQPKVTKPKATITYKSIYDQNISKALSALKKAVKPSKTTVPTMLPHIQEISDEVPEIATGNNIATNNISTANKANDATMNNTGKTSVHECNYASIRVEDIAADIEPSVDHGDDINYSPVNSPRHESLVAHNPESDPRQSPGRPTQSHDPLNLQEELSFFDDVPVASSSMNMSVRHPLASPWRVEFGSLPIKWHSNTYVKPNMTPAVESSFICSEESNKKRHVYTNLVPEANESLPQIVSNTPNLKQTSIISFIKEVAERQAKKKRGRSVSPSKATAIFGNIESSTPNKKQAEDVSNNKNPTPNSNVSKETSASSNNTSNDKENSKEERKTRKRKNDENICDRPAKSPRKQKDKDCTYFGFDESEDLDQENVSPVKAKDNGRSRALRSRSRAVLQEINGPTRAALPLAAKSKTATSSEAINRVYDGLKSAADAPVFPEENVEINVTNVEDATFNEDSQSVHLFEDIELIHHLKPTRKSYGKAKKVTFMQRSSSDSDSLEPVPANANDTSFEDDLGDLTFEVPNVKEKKKSKKKPKKQMSKKEEKEAEEWAAGFNSMCEEVEEFPLVVE